MVVSEAPVPPRRSSSYRRQKQSFIFMLLPALLLIIGIMVFFLQGIAKSFTNEKSYIQDPVFIGLDNYVALFNDSTFLTGLGATLLYVLVVLSLQIPLALSIALLLEKTSFMRQIGRNFIVLPLLIPPIVAGLMWKTMMQPSAGVLNYLLTGIGLPAGSWLTDPGTSLLSVVLIDTWAFTSFSTLIILAGLQALPESLREAASVDGAGWWQTFRNVSLPMLLPYIVLVALFRVADSLKQFDLVWPVTRGGPLNSTRLLHVQGYEEAFRFSSPAMAMAIIFVLWLIIYLASFLLLRLWRRTVNAVE